MAKPRLRQRRNLLRHIFGGPMQRKIFDNLARNFVDDLDGLFAPEERRDVIVKTRRALAEWRLVSEAFESFSRQKQAQAFDQKMIEKLWHCAAILIDHNIGQHSR